MKGRLPVYPNEQETGGVASGILGVALVALRGAAHARHAAQDHLRRSPAAFHRQFIARGCTHRQDSRHCRGFLRRCFANGLENPREIKLTARPTATSLSPRAAPTVSAFCVPRGRREPRTAKFSRVGSIARSALPSIRRPDRQFPAAYRGSAFVALHGSWNRHRRTGYKIVRVLLKDGAPPGDYEDFVTGFVTAQGSVWGRRIGIAVAKGRRAAIQRRRQRHDLVGWFFRPTSGSRYFFFRRRILNLPGSVSVSGERKPLGAISAL